MRNTNLTYTDWDFCADPVLSLPAISIEQALSSYSSSKTIPEEIDIETLNNALDFLKKSITGESIIESSARDFRFIIDFDAFESYKHSLRAFEFNRDLQNTTLSNVLATSKKVIEKLVNYYNGEDIETKTEDVDLTKKFFYSLSIMPVLNK